MGTINRLRNMHFSLNEKHKKLQLCVMSSNGSIGLQFILEVADQL